MMQWTKQDYQNWPYADFTQFIGEGGHWLLTSPFVETRKTGAPIEDCVYTLKIRENHNKPSLYQIIFWAKGEYDAAMKVCGNWEMWLRWKESKALWEGTCGSYRGTGLRSALEAMEARIAGEALAEIIDRADGGDYRAAKDLVTWGVPKKKTGKKVEQVEPDRNDVIAIADRIARGNT